ncbi:TcaA second domain-containing protein [Halobacillus naozhouensis]|uniref:PEGA domain-containing protein n=1 Tax=Halobacillus naozhouensis TaxID=554880 RepID=A0ABY8IX92_9BACI|nr:hypothetical protein [Halobacillus naozhouensis]WFT73794.1 hypothetical protein P9989_15660 [Halobacillus naozhouensis]
MGECRKCGREIPPSQQGCEDCNSARKAKQPAEFAENHEWLNASHYYSDHMEEQRSYRKRNWRKIFITVITFVLLAGFAVTFWMYLTKVTSAQHVVQEFEEAVKEEDANRLVDLVAFNHENQSFNVKQAELMVDYYNQHSDQFVSTLSYLRSVSDGEEDSSGSNSIIHLQNQGSQWLLFDQYALTLDPVSVDVSSNAENVALFLDGNKIGTITGNSVYELAGLTPGSHIVKGIVKANGKKHDEIISINTYQTSQPVSLEFENITPEATLESLSGSLEEDLKQAVTDHVKEYVAAYEAKDISKFKRMQSEEYLEASENEIEKLEEMGAEFEGEVTKIVFDLGSMEITSEEGKRPFTSTMYASITFQSGYFDENVDSSERLKEENTYIWNYDLTYDDQEDMWLISSGTPVSSMRTEETELVEF